MKGCVRALVSYGEILTSLGKTFHDAAFGLGAPKAHKKRRFEHPQKSAERGGDAIMASSAVPVRPA
jgi:hypothetical protein